VTELQKAENALAAVTNRRQARRILDAGQPTAARFDINERTVYVTVADGSLWTVCYGRGRGLYDARACEPGWVRLCETRAHTVDVEHDPTPSHVRMPAPRRGDGS